MPAPPRQLEYRLGQGGVARRAELEAKRQELEREVARVEDAIQVGRVDYEWRQRIING